MLIDAEIMAQKIKNPEGIIKSKAKSKRNVIIIIIIIIFKPS